MTDALPASHDLLSWDSDLFGFPVARLTPAGLEPARFEDTLDRLRREGVRLAYAMVPWEDVPTRAFLDARGTPMVDRKVTFRKRLPGGVGMPPGVVVWDGLETTAELEDLAVASGHQSRFKVDGRVPPHVFPALYRAWIRRSVRREIADAVLVIHEGGILAGLVTLACHEGVGEIGLLAVAEGLRGRGIGRRLMAAAEAWSGQRGADALEVVTQGTNGGACGLYLASGCLVVREQAIYHVWMEPLR